MSILIGILITFLVVILVLYLINMLPLDGRAKQIAQAVVIIIGIISLLIATTSGRHHVQAIRIDSFEVDDCGRPCDRPPCRAPPSGGSQVPALRQLFR